MNVEGKAIPRKAWVSFDSHPNDFPLTSNSDVMSDKLAKELARNQKPNLPSWSQFTQNSSVHGLKYIFDKSPTGIYRRVIWVVCVLSAFTLFVVQVGVRAKDYFDYKTNVDVQVVYTRNITFPAVTICNQNNFRLTAVAQKGMYNFIDDVFKVDNISELDFARYQLNDIDPQQFILEAAHQIEDFIDSCTWQGVGCDIATDFERTVTALGVCYTFNNGRLTPARQVTNTGFRNSLSLVINVEQYEYMRGPQNDAGVKILLHDQSEFPNINDLGFTVSPGTHTLISIKRSEVNTLEPPWGLCSSIANQTLHECVAECQFRAISSRCGCQGFLGKTIPNLATESCDLENQMGCVYRNPDVQISDENCSCPLPCERVTYDPTLSYSMLSRFNIDKVALKTETKKRIVQEKLLKACEVYQRDVPEVAAENQNVLSRIIIARDQLRETLTNVQIVLSGNGSEGIANYLSNNLHHSLMIDTYEIGNELEMRWTYMTTPNEHLTPATPKLTAYVEQFLDLRNKNENNLLDSLHHCEFDQDIPFNPEWEKYKEDLKKSIDMKFHQAPAGEVLAKDEETITVDNIIESTTVEPDNNFGLAAYFDCLELRHLFHDFAKEMSQDGSFLLSTYEDLIKEYETKIDFIFTNTTADPYQFVEHGVCLDFLHKLNVTVTEPLKSTLTYLGNISGTESYANLLEISQFLITVANESSLQDPESLEQQIINKCWWILQYENEKEKLQHFLIPFGSAAVDEAQEMKESFRKLTQYVTDLISTFEVKIIPVLHVLDNYLAINTTWKDMSDTLQDTVLKKALADLADMGQEFKVLFHDEFLEANNKVSHIMSHGLKHLYDSFFPVLSDTFVYNLKLTSLATGAHLSEIDNLLANYTSDRRSTYTRAIELLFERVELSLYNISSDIPVYTDQLTSRLEILMESLQEYLKKTETNQDFYLDNFLLVDIYYKELSYDRIEQQPAFEMLSLLSEVGGFLGLLLGASVLTVCELLDYLVLIGLTKCRKPVEQQPWDQPN